MQIRFLVPCVPVPQPRQRTRVVETGAKPFAQNYTPTSDPVNAFKASLQLCASDAYDGPPLDGPIRLDLLIVMPRPNVKVWKKKPMPRDWYAGRVDRDNVLKAVQDALQKILWRNDSQVVAGDTVIVIASGDEQPHVELRIETLGPTEPVLWRIYTPQDKV